MRKVYVEVKTRLIIEMDDGIEVSEVMDDMDYSFSVAEMDGASIVDSELDDFEVTDSK